MFAQVKNDWCHVCGERRNTIFIELDYFENAEHPDWGDTQYLRMCKMCVNEMKHKVDKIKIMNSGKPIKKVLKP